MTDPTLRHERCLPCQQQAPLPHEHRIPRVAGAIAMLDRDDATDPMFCEEALWVALELALLEWHPDTPDLTRDRPEARALQPHAPALARTLSEHRMTTYALHGLAADVTFTVNDDQHLESDASCTEIICTITERLAA